MNKTITQEIFAHPLSDLLPMVSSKGYAQQLRAQSATQCAFSGSNLML